jgi:parallel beta-helix repeat protein
MNAAVTSLLSLNGVQNIIIDGIALHGGNTYSDYGILVANAYGISIQHTDIRAIKTNGTAIYFWNTSGSLLASNTIHDNGGLGILLQNASYNSLTANQLINNQAGLSLQ